MDLADSEKTVLYYSVTKGTFPYQAITGIDRLSSGFGTLNFTFKFFCFLGPECSDVAMECYSGGNDLVEDIWYGE